MGFLRRLLGIWVMLAGILGLILSIAGLVGVWLVRPTIGTYMDSTITTLKSSIDTSQSVMQVTGKALGATVDSIDALSVMLDATATSVNDTQPVLDQVNYLMGEKLPATMEAATESLIAAQQGAEVLDSSIRSLNTFRAVMSAVPFVGGFVEAPTSTYDPEVPLAKSLGDIAVQFEDLPQTFSEMAVNLDKADDSLETIQSSLVTMADSVSMISASLSEYETMIGQSESSMDNVKSILTGLQTNQNTIINYGAIALTLVLLWMLTAQVVMFSQGWELFHGTAGSMEGSAPEPEEVKVTVEANETEA